VCGALALTAVFAALAFLLGLMAGFLINVVSIRLAGGHPLLGKISCTRARHPLTLRQALPVLGYLLQRGRCSTCGKRLSIAYPLTELATGLLFLFLYLVEGLGTSFWLHSAYTAILMLVLVIDWKHRDIYLSVIFVGGLLALVGSFFLPGIGPGYALVGAAVAGGFFLLAYVVARLVFRHIEEPLGSGDVFLALMMGLMLGFPNVVGVLVLGPLIAGAVAIVLLATRKSGMGDFMPYGVPLCVAAIVFLVNPGPLADALHLPTLVNVLSELLGHS
jgi:prepilin signal peptidase PulO-like enzyme (type II secretory pathway)